MFPQLWRHSSQILRHVVRDALQSLLQKHRERERAREQERERERERAREICMYGCLYRCDVLVNRYMLYLDEHQCVGQVLVKAVTFLGPLQLILTLPGHAFQILPGCTANKQHQNQHKERRRQTQSCIYAWSPFFNSSFCLPSFPNKMTN